MYECCNIKRFLRLLILDIFIFVICLILFLFGRLLFFAIFPEKNESDNKQSEIVYENEYIYTDMENKDISEKKSPDS